MRNEKSVDLEIAQVLRGFLRAEVIDLEVATSALADFRDLDFKRHSHQPLLERVWELRENITAYDAIYVALAETLDCVLVTCDAKLARAPGLSGRVELVQARLAAAE